jgi:hypothetical protein
VVAAPRTKVRTITTIRNMCECESDSLSALHRAFSARVVREAADEVDIGWMAVAVAAMQRGGVRMRMLAWGH